MANEQVGLGLKGPRSIFWVGRAKLLGMSCLGRSGMLDPRKISKFKACKIAGNVFISINLRKRLWNFSYSTKPFNKLKNKIKIFDNIIRVAIAHSAL